MTARPLAVLLLALTVALLNTDDAWGGERQKFKVCADPNYPPFSTRDGDGIENKLADLLAAELELPVNYSWFPARIGFIRNTLRAEDPAGDGYKCDVVMNVPHQYELTITTRPYYTSTYALVYVAGRGLDDVESGQDLINLTDERKQSLRIGMNERDPGTLWLAKYEMYEQIQAYQAQTGDLEYYPGRAITEDLFAGKLNAAVLWGPIAGHATRLGARQGLDVRLIPLLSEPGVRFHFSISLGTRHPDDDWRDQLDTLLDKNRAKIEALLREHAVPLVTPDGSSVVSLLAREG